MFGIEGYEPQWHHSGRALASAHRSRFRRLVGQYLHDTWLMWDLDANRWFADGPVVLGFPDANVEITHRKFDECAITWDQVDMVQPLHWPDLRLDWRANAHPALERIRGRRLREVNVIERLMAAEWRPVVLHAVELLFEGQSATSVASGPAPSPPPPPGNAARRRPALEPAKGSAAARFAAAPDKPGVTRLAIFNALDENGLTDAPEVDLPVGRWRRVPIA